MNRRLYYYLGAKSIRGLSGMSYEEFIDTYNMRDFIPYNIDDLNYPEECSLAVLNCAMYDEDWDDQKIYIGDIREAERLSDQFAYFFRQPIYIQEISSLLDRFIKKLAKSSAGSDLDMQPITDIANEIKDFLKLAKSKAKLVLKQDEADRKEKRRTDPLYNG